ncbi:hypothetical protein H3146_23360 [Streptomyces sp. OF3]|uniref:Uncharacterized protein n=1 Tax=Streptomyces alkaliterrae TaxID=2213162 RepID=A0A7W3ZQ31_9ACTN|nr:DUF6643 family protein [Streptomyces alkaliterrae]MBB1256271.1 hypothetical protein [Streptomyces alkaliterrae]
MTSPSSFGGYGGGYYSSPSFADTPIYDSLVAERGTPQIAPIRVPAAYESPASSLPALPSALPALASGPSASSAPPQRGYGGHPAPTQQHAPLQQAPAPYIPQQPADRGYPTQQGYPHYQQQYQQQYQQPQMRPVAPRPAPPRPMAQQPAAQGRYDDPYGRPHPSAGY